MTPYIYKDAMPDTKLLDIAGFRKLVERAKETDDKDLLHSAMLRALSYNGYMTDFPQELWEWVRKGT